MSAFVGVPSWFICTVRVTIGCSRAPGVGLQHPLIFWRPPSISLAVTTAARLGAAGAVRVTCCTGLGCCSGVCTLVLESWFFRMLSTRASTLGFAGCGLGGGGLGGAAFFPSGLGGSGLGGSGFFSSVEGSGSLGFIAITSSVGFGGSGLGFS